MVGKAKIMIHTVKGETNHPATIVENHVLLVKEPGSEYIGHVSPAISNSVILTSNITAFLENKFDINRKSDCSSM